MEYIIVLMSYENEVKKIASRLKQARIASNISQLELANKLGVTQSFVSKLESAQIKIDVVILKELALILKIDIKKLIY